MTSSPLDQPLAAVLGERTAKAFARGLGLETVADLLGHYPRRYAKRGELTELGALPPDENITLVAEVLQVQERSMRARRGSLLEVLIGDGTGTISLTFFNQSWRAKELRPGVRGIFAGKLGEYRGTMQLAHPDYELFDRDGDEAEGRDPEAAKRWAEQPIPIYPATSTVASWQLQRAIAVVLDGLPDLPDPIPAIVREGRKLHPYHRALELIHRPTTEQDAHAARHTLKFQEALLLQAALLQRREQQRASTAYARRPEAGGPLERFDAALPFQLTGDQRAVGETITAGLASESPMNLLVQGEVGSGKTLVALRAMLAVAEDGGQSALLAPTEVLAAQHLRSIERTLGPELVAELKPVLLTGQLPVAERRKALLAIVSGQSRIVVGTHALLGDKVEFSDLGLVVVDEQHRFGVEQREALRAKGATPPHVLVLTATPIPRTVAMTVFGDLDVATIRELPAGRAGITSHVVPLADHPQWIARVWERMGEELAQGRQAFVVCPAIEEPADGKAPRTTDDGTPLEGGGASDAPLAAVETLLPQLRAQPSLAGRRIEALHGRMKGEEKDAIMRAFAAGDIDVLVATTVIEVGVDVPNASTMAVLDAERFGVSQLHQLRGRVGRGGVPGLCLLVTRAEEGTLARERVEAVAATLDGFELAQADLDLRQEGDVLGSNQSGGRSSLRILRVARDGELIAAARASAEQLIEAPGGIAAHPELAAALERRLDESARAYLDKG